MAAVAKAAVAKTALAKAAARAPVEPRVGVARLIAAQGDVVEAAAGAAVPRTASRSAAGNALRGPVAHVTLPLVVR
jgi:hypothetical protein